MYISPLLLLGLKQNIKKFKGVKKSDRQIFFKSNVFKKVRISTALPTFWTVSKNIFETLETF